MDYRPDDRRPTDYRDDRRPFMDDRRHDDRRQDDRRMDDRGRASGSSAWDDYRGPDDRDRRDRWFFEERDRLSDPGHPGRPTPRWMSDAEVPWLQKEGCDRLCVSDCMSLACSGPSPSPVRRSLLGRSWCLGSF